jgi:hypothetical protein
MLLLLLAGSGGCASRIEEWRSNTLQRWRATFAWYSEPHPKDIPHKHYYAKGWKDAFFDVANGSDGHAPVLPPNQYWSSKYQNPAGHAKIRAWFAGYQDGAIAAEQIGVREWNYIQTGPPRGPVHDGQVVSYEVGPMAEPVLTPPGTPVPPRAAPAEIPAENPQSNLQYGQPTGVMPAAAQMPIGVPAPVRRASPSAGMDAGPQQQTLMNLIR